MIGQSTLKTKISLLPKLPRFMIIEGSKGCGKKTLAKQVAKQHNLELIFIETKIDSIRNMIKIANESTTSILFYIDDGDKMSVGAKNTLLKVTEEAPNNTYIILSTENKELVLPTLKSRGEMFSFHDYKKQDFIEYKKELSGSEVVDEHIELVLPNLSYITDYDDKKVNEIYNYCMTILKRIREANGANAFKITEKLKIKDTDEGWDINVFLFALTNINNSLIIESAKNGDNNELDIQIKYAQILTKIKRMINNTLFSKSFIIDRLIIDFKGV